MAGLSAAIGLSLAGGLRQLTPTGWPSHGHTAGGSNSCRDFRIYACTRLGNGEGEQSQPASPISRHRHTDCRAPVRHASAHRDCHRDCH